MVNALRAKRGPYSVTQRIRLNPPTPVSGEPIVYGFVDQYRLETISPCGKRGILLGLMETAGPRKRKRLILLDIAATTLIYCTSLVVGLFSGVLLGALQPLVSGQAR